MNISRWEWCLQFLIVFGCGLAVGYVHGHEPETTVVETPEESPDCSDTTDRTNRDTYVIRNDCSSYICQCLDGSD